MLALVRTEGMTGLLGGHYIIAGSLLSQLVGVWPPSGDRGSGQRSRQAVLSLHDQTFSDIETAAATTGVSCRTQSTARFSVRAARVSFT